MADPCYTIRFEPSYLKYDSKELPPSDFTTIRIMINPYDPPKVIQFTDFTEYVTLYDPFTGLETETFVNSSYCGAINYTVEYQGSGDPYNPELITNVEIDPESQKYIITGYTESNEYNRTSHSLALVASVRDAQPYYPKSYFDFMLIIDKCIVTYLATPVLYNFTYMLGAGEIPVYADRSMFVQDPPCGYNATISSYFKGGIQFNESMVNFTDNIQDEELSWILNANEEKYKGAYRVIIEYVIDNDSQYFVDTSFQWDLFLKWVKWPLEHEPPQYAVDAVPTSVALYPGEEINIDTGAASIDTVLAEISVVAENDLWKDFMVIKISEDNWRV